MKIAVIVTGHARNYRDNYMSIQHCLAGHDVDIYISTWSVDSPGRGSCGQFALIAVDLKPLLQLYQPQAMHVEDHDSYYANRLPAIQLENSPASADIIAHHGSLAQGSFWVERIRDMYATIKRGYDLIQDPDQYDLIMRIRFDAVLKRCALKQSHDIVFPVIRDGEVNAEYYSDWTAYGTPAAMLKYAILGEHMDSLYHDHGVNIGHADKLLKAYVEKENLSALVDNDYAYYH